MIDSGEVDLGLSTLTKGQDAKVFFGASTAEDGFLVTSSTNTVKGVLEGVTINLVSASESPISLTVSRDTARINESVKQLVTTFNDVIGRINQYDFYNVDTQERGALLGNSTVANVREALYRQVQAKAQGVTTQYQFLRQVGITIGRDGQIGLDQAKFDAAYENDPEAVENLFASYQATAAGTEEIAPGVTIPQTEPTVTVRGFGDLFDNLLEGLTNSIDGMVTRADRSFKEQIELITKRISDFDLRLGAKRQRLQAQFAAMESALAKFSACEVQQPVRSVLTVGPTKAYFGLMPAYVPAPIIAADSAEAAVRGADLIVLVTSSPTPVIEDHWVSKGAHVVCVGACRPNQQEMPPALVARSGLYVDSKAAALVESGDVVMNIAAKLFDASHVRGEIGELVLGRVPGRRDEDEITVFKSLGMAVEDVVAADLVFRRASESGAGTELTL